MKIKKLFLILPLLSLIILPSTFASAACSWKTVVTSFAGNTGGCVQGVDTQAEDAKCPIPKPGDGVNSYSTCCCSEVASLASASTAKAPKFTIPVPEIKIPTVNLTEVTCVPGTGGEYSCSIPWIGEYINGIYQYGINIAGILAAIVLMAGGLLWLVSGGDASKITQAKDMIIGAITGLLILLCAYIILTQINPDLIKMRSLTLGNIAKDVTPTPPNAAAFLMNCKATNTGPCAVSNMLGFGTRNYEASAICMAESGGNPAAFNSSTFCMNGGYAVWGLFQFNLSANNFTDQNGKVLNCPKAFNKTWTNSSPTCSIINQNLYDACVAAAINPQLSILNAQNLVIAAGGWGPWEANSKWCGFGK